MAKNKTGKSKKTSNKASEPSNPTGIDAWLLAARPKTLAAACSPVLFALALAYRDILAGRVPHDFFVVLPGLCCLIFAILAQVAANFINDYADWRKGADTEERKGPRRAVANGWISPRAMLVGTVVTLAVACLVGLGTLPYVAPGQRITIVVVGALCCLFCLLYSVGPIPLAYIGLGDVLVVSFFGVVAVCYTYFLQTGAVTLDAFLAGLAIGLATDNILVSNNYRDRDEDRAAKKYTLIAIFGERFGRYFYLVNGLAVVAILSYVLSKRGELAGGELGALVVYLALHLFAWRKLSRIRSGSGLVRVLAMSSQNLLILCVMLAGAMVL